MTGRGNECTTELRCRLKSNKKKPPEFSFFQRLQTEELKFRLIKKEV